MVEFQTTVNISLEGNSLQNPEEEVCSFSLDSPFTLLILSHFVTFKKILNINYIFLDLTKF